MLNLKKREETPETSSSHPHTHSRKGYMRVSPPETKWSGLSASKSGCGSLRWKPRPTNARKQAALEGRRPPSKQAESVWIGSPLGVISSLQWMPHICEAEWDLNQHRYFQRVCFATMVGREGGRRNPIILGFLTTCFIWGLEEFHFSLYNREGKPRISLYQDVFHYKYRRWMKFGSN